MIKVTHPKSKRRGVATLEFVMALPLLFVLMICIMWEGFWLIGQAEVLITARNDAWKKRFDNVADAPLMFPVMDDPVPLGLYHANRDYVTEKASTKVDITPAFNAIPGPESSHTILAGSWDSKAMPLNKPPDFVLMGKAAIIGGFGSMLDLASATSDPLGLVEKFTGARKESEQIDRSTKDEAKQDEQGGTSGGSGGGAGGGAGGDGKTPEQAKQESKEELERQKKLVRERFKALGATVSYNDEVRPVNGELDAAQDAVLAAQTESEQKSKAAREREGRREQEKAARGSGPRQSEIRTRQDHVRAPQSRVHQRRERGRRIRHRTIRTEPLGESRILNKPSTTPDAVHEVPKAGRLDRAFRAAMLLLTFAVCCYVAWGLGRWWALAQHGPPPLDTHLSDAAELDPFAAALRRTVGVRRARLEPRIETLRTQCPRRRVRTGWATLPCQNSTRSCPTPIPKSSK